MLKTLLVSAALVAGTSTFALAGMQTGRSAGMDHHPMHYHGMTHHHMRHNRVTANGRCNGRSYGTGQRGCGSATGGPHGGLINRN